MKCIVSALVFLATTIVPQSVCSAQTATHDAIDFGDAEFNAAMAKLNANSERLLKTWGGVYSSPAETSMFTGTVLSIDKGIGDLHYRMSFYSDLRRRNSIDQDELRGNCLAHDDRIYVPVAHGRYYKGKPTFHASVKCYTRIKLNGEIVLLRDDARTKYLETRQLDGYGVLIRVSATAKRLGQDLANTQRKSIKELFPAETKDLVTLDDILDAEFEQKKAAEPRNAPEIAE